MPSTLSKRDVLSLLLVLGVIWVVGVAGDAVNPALRYTRSGIENGQWWCLLTSHFVHLGLYHTLLNTLGLVLIAALFGHLVGIAQWSIIAGVLAVGINGGLYFFSPEITYCLGLSGLLHGLFAVGIVLSATSQRIVSAIAFGLLAAKLLWEQTPGYDINYLQGYMHAPVVVDAHLYGASIGLIIGVAVLVCERAVHPGWRRLDRVSSPSRR